MAAGNTEYGQHVRDADSHINIILFVIGGGAPIVFSTTSNFLLYSFRNSLKMVSNEQLAEQFVKLYGIEPEVRVTCPGRVNLIGTLLLVLPRSKLSQKYMFLWKFCFTV